MKETTRYIPYRWRILSLLFFATTINYFDRSILAVLGPTLKDHVFHWTNSQYADITMSFLLAYGMGLLVMGSLIDRVGTRKGFTLSIGIWSLFSLMHAFINRSLGWLGFLAARFGLGFGESGNFPACIKSVAQWFPQRERAWATGIFNAGSNIGAILAPLIIPLLVANNGRHWQLAFCLTFLLSLLWIILWRKTDKKPGTDTGKYSGDNPGTISDRNPQQGKLPWIRLLGLKETWAFSLAKITDAVWWFYLFWGSFFLHARFHLQLSGLAFPILIIYFLSDLGSLFGGWLSSYMIRKGWSVNRSRKLTLLLCALLVLPVVFAPVVSQVWFSVLLIGMAAGGHQAWSANIFTLASDLFPGRATATVVGIGGSIGTLSSILASFFLGKALDSSGISGYFIAFLIAGCLYLVVLGIIQLLVPRMTPLGEDLKPCLGTVDIDDKGPRIL